MPLRFADDRALVATIAVAVLKADRQATPAAHAGAVLSDVGPLQIPGGKPVTAEPGQTPQAPVILLCTLKS